MEKITPEQFFKDLIEFNKISENRNDKDQRLGQYFINKYHITNQEDIWNLFYKENFMECLAVIEANYVDYGRKDND